jgi:hypothetical protein
MSVTAPVCKVCGKAHWLGRQPHQFTNEPDPVIERELTAQEIRGQGVNKMGKRKQSTASVSTPPVAVNAPVMDRKAYMREYMKRKRAEGKQA